MVLSHNPNHLRRFQRFLSALRNKIPSKFLLLSRYRDLKILIAQLQTLLILRLLLQLQYLHPIQKISDAATGAITVTLKGHSDGVTSVALFLLQHAPILSVPISRLFLSFLLHLLLLLLLFYFIISFRPVFK